MSSSHAVCASALRSVANLRSGQLLPRTPQGPFASSSVLQLVQVYWQHSAWQLFDMRSGEAINAHGDAPRTSSRVSRGGRLVAPVREVRHGGTQQHFGFHSFSR
jgi:hypothetical protein